MGQSTRSLVRRQGTIAVTKSVSITAHRRRPPRPKTLQDLWQDYLRSRRRLFRL